MKRGFFFEANLMIYLFSVHIHIKLPVKLTEEQREVLEEYARLETDTPGKLVIF